VATGPRAPSSWRGRSPRWSSRFTTHTNIGGPQAFAEGLDFRGDRNPDYWDFFYFATSFGAASQTSDVSILTKPLRRLATLHAIISFSFNTAVLALAINLAASMI
jgi:uncharacterized membrane protein